MFSYFLTNYLTEVHYRSFELQAVARCNFFDTAIKHMNLNQNIIVKTDAHKLSPEYKTSFQTVYFTHQPDGFLGVAGGGFPTCKSIAADLKLSFSLAS